MNLDDAIKHCEEVAEENYGKATAYLSDTRVYEYEEQKCLKCADEHMQLAEWLRDYKRLLKQTQWTPISEGLPKTDNENSMNNYNVLLWVKNKSYPEKEPQIYLGKLRHIDGDDGSGNFWGIEIKPCDWTIWGWSYFNEPEVIAWMPLPKPYKGE